MELSMQDIFFGFVRRYETFQINYETAGATHFTIEILHHFERLGAMLGYQTRFEKEFRQSGKKRRYDLIWYDDDINDPYLHVEHENNGSWVKLEDTVNKIDESIAHNMIAIMYPQSKDLWNDILDLIKKKQKSWSSYEEVLVILDPYFIEHNYCMEGYIFSGNRDIEVLKSTIQTNEKTGSLFAFS